MIQGFLAGLLASFFTEHLSGVIRRLSVAIIEVSIAGFPAPVADRWRDELLADLGAEQQDGVLFGLRFAIRVARRASELELELRPAPASLREEVEINVAHACAQARRILTNRSRLLKAAMLSSLAIHLLALVSLDALRGLLGPGYEPGRGWHTVPLIEDSEVMISIAGLVGTALHVVVILTAAALAVWGGLDLARSRGWGLLPTLLLPALAGSVILIAPASARPYLMAVATGLGMYGAACAAPALLAAIGRPAAALAGMMDRRMPALARVLMSRQR